MFGGNRVFGELEGVEKLIGSMWVFGDIIDVDVSFVVNNIEWVSLVLGVLDSSLMCIVDLVCVSVCIEL